MSIEGLASLIALIGAGVAIYLSWRKAPHETGNLDADTADKYQKIADQAADRALRLNERVNELETQVDKLTKQVKELSDENTDLKEWAERLVHQVKSLGAQPVALRRKAAQP